MVELNLKKRRRRIRLKRFVPFYIMMAPALIYVFINNYIPMAGIVIAFKNYKVTKGIWGSDWAGFANFEFLFSSPDAWNITRNTVLYNVAFIVVNTVLGIAIALFMNEIKGRMSKNIYQTAILMPYLVSIAVVSYLVYGFLSPTTGLFNSLIKSTGGLAVNWYGSPAYWPFILIFVNTWKNIGYQSIIYLATIVGIDYSFYEAAAVDGANRWKKIIHITLPSIKPTIVILTLMSVGRMFFSDFGLFYQVPMNSGQLIDITSTIDTYVFRGLMERGNIGMSAAAGVYQSVVGFALILSANMLVRKLSKDEALF